MNHTPGPWNVGEPTEYINQLRIEPCIGVVYGAGEEIKANARLIAAAPDLLGCLQYALLLLDVDRQTLRECSTGPNGHIHTDDAHMCDELDSVAARWRAVIAQATGGKA